MGDVVPIFRLEPTLPEYNVAKHRITASVYESLRLYVERRCSPGSFLLAVLGNDLLAAVNAGDAEHLDALRDIVRYCYWHLPASSWGSPKAVARWLDGAL